MKIETAMRKARDLHERANRYAANDTHHLRALRNRNVFDRGIAKLLANLVMPEIGSASLASDISPTRTRVIALIVSAAFCEAVAQACVAGDAAWS